MAIQDYFGYQINPGTSAEALASRRRIAEQLMQEGGSTAPIRSPWQGVARITGGLMGGLEGYRAEQSEAARHAEAQKLMAGLFGLGDDGAAPAQPSSPASLPAPAAAAMPAPASPAGGAMAASGAMPAAAPGVVAGITAAESGGNPNATNPNSSAAGRGQFIDSTWLDTIKKHRPDIAAGKTDAQLLALKTGQATAPLQDEMTAAYASDNAAALKAAGVEPTPANLRLAHYFGPGGAIATAKAAPNTPMSAILSPDVMRANPNLVGMTAGRAQRWAAAQMAQDTAGSPAAASAPDMPATSSNPRRMLRQAVALSSNPETKALGDALLLKYLTADAKGTDDIKEFEYARTQGFKGNLQDWILEQKSAGASKEGKQPILMTGPNGETTIGFATGSAGVTPAKMPPGYSYSSKAHSVETPTSVINYDQAGNVISVVPKDISGAASQKVQGEAAGAARVAAPAAKTMVDSALSLGTQLRNHPGLDAATGAQGLWDPRNYLPGTDAADFNQMRTEVAAKTFMAAREALKGAGAVTDFEGEKGEQAIGNLARAQSKQQFLEALGRVEQMMAQSYRDLGKKANLDKVSTGGNAPIEPLANVQKWERGPDGVPRRVP